MISDLVQGVLRKAIRRFAKKSNRPIEEIQLMIWWNAEEDKPNYKKLCFEEPNQAITFLDVMNIPTDIFGQERLVAEFITKRYEQYALEYNCDKSSLFLIILLDEQEESEELKAFLYKGSQELQEINLELFFT